MYSLRPLCVVSVIVIYFASCNSNQDLEAEKTIRLRPDTGIDNIVLGRSTEAEILKYRKFQYERSEGGSISCFGLSPSEIVESINYTGDSGKIYFKFAIDYIEDKEPKVKDFKLRRIVVYDSGAAFSNGIAIKHSHMKAVIASMGEGALFENNIRYDSLGLSLWFNHDSILERVDLEKAEKLKKPPL